jgi:DNA-binding transcriptional regulator YbjK
VLADAAIRVLATEGTRGLTHRAVDRVGGMPPGTTSAYYRTRQALLAGLVRRLVDRDQAELHALGQSQPPVTGTADLVARIASFVEMRLTGEGRERSLARFACAVESARHPELREILVPRENAARDAVRDFLAARGVTDPERRTVTLLACVDGLVFDRLVGGGHVPVEEIEGLVGAALR